MQHFRSFYLRLLMPTTRQSSFRLTFGPHFNLFYQHRAFTAPVALHILLHEKENNFDMRFLSLAWLVLPVSVVAIQLWLRRVKTDPIRAAMWLYLCPVFGFAFRPYLLMNP